MLKLGRAQAAAILAIKNSGLEVAEGIFPKVVKEIYYWKMEMQSKEQVAFMLKKMVTLPDEETLMMRQIGSAVAWFVI